MIPAFIFWPIAIFIIASAAGVVHSKNIVHSALLLILTFIGIAGVFILLQADFLGLVQILIYAGAVSVLIVFAVMLTRKSEIKNSNPFNKLRWVSLIVGFGLFTLIARLITVSRFTYKNIEMKNSIAAIVEGYFGNYIISFEIAAIFLLVALAGAIILAKGVKN